MVAPLPSVAGPPVLPPFTELDFHREGGKVCGDRPRAAILLVSIHVMVRNGWDP